MRFLTLKLYQIKYGRLSETKIEIFDLSTNVRLDIGKRMIFYLKISRDILIVSYIVRLKGTENCITPLVSEINS
jgi:hypothetical protein